MNDDPLKEPLAENDETILDTRPVKPIDPEATLPSEKPTGRSMELSPRVGALPREMPARLGRYLIEGRLGQGSMGAVYLARQDGLNRRVALKVLLDGPHASGSVRHRFTREARAMARLNHPNIVAVHEVGDYEGQPFFTMDYVDGLPLNQMATRLNISSPAVLADICRQVAEAVGYAHSKGIVHRDLKPSNILVTASGAPLVTDFGLAKDLQSESLFSVSGDIMGTPAYMSPEQASGHVEQIDERSDIYSIGAILYTLLAGHEPFKGGTLVETLDQVINTPPEPLRRAKPNLNPDLEAIALKAMEKDPNDRYQKAVYLAEDLQRYLDNRPITARKWTRRYALRQWTRRHQRGAWLGVMGLTAMTVLLLGSVRMFSRSYLDLMRHEMQASSWEARASAVGSLGRELIHPEQLQAHHRSDALALFMQASEDKQPEVVSAWLTAIQNGGDFAQTLSPPAWARIQVLAEQPDDPNMRNLALDTIGSLHRPESVTYLLNRLHEPDPAVRLRIVRNLGQLKSRRALGPLISLMSSDPVTRTEAKAALDLLYAEGQVSPIYTTATHAALSKLTDAMNQHNRQLEAALGQAPTRPAQDPMATYKKALQSDDKTAALQAIYELGSQTDTQAIPLLMEALKKPELGSAAAQALSRHADDSIYPELLRRLSQDGTDAVYAGLALGFLKEKNALDPLLTELSTQRDADKARVLVQALGELGQPEAAPQLRQVAIEFPQLQPVVQVALKQIGAKP